MKKNVRSRASAAPIAPEYWSSASGTSAALMAVSVGGVTHDATDSGQNPSMPNVLACQPPGRPMYNPSPCGVLVPDLVTMLTAGPAVNPNSAEKAFESVVISCTAPSGS